MEVVKFVYNSQEIEFDFVGDRNVMVNATQMANLFNKRLDIFLKSRDTKDYIKLLCSKPINGNDFILEKKQIISSHGCNGTYMHKKLAIKFAMWLDKDFELWVTDTIDFILSKDFKIRELLNRKKILLDKVTEMKCHLLNTYPEINEYFDLEDELKKVTNKIARSNRNV